VNYVDGGGTRFMNFALFIGGLFLLLQLSMLDHNAAPTHLDEVSILEVTKCEDGIHLEMETALCQENGDAMNICTEMILFEGTIEDSAKCIKVVKYLKENCESKLHWSITLDAQNEPYVLYLFIRSSLGENEYSKIEITKYDKGWEASHKELGFLEYSRVYWYSRFREFIQMLETISGNL
jgi:hypothetical protein